MELTQYLVKKFSWLFNVLVRLLLFDNIKQSLKASGAFLVVQPEWTFWGTRKQPFLAAVEYMHVFLEKTLTSKALIFPVCTTM